MVVVAISFGVDFIVFWAAVRSMSATPSAPRLPCGMTSDCAAIPSPGVVLSTPAIALPFVGKALLD